MTLAKFLDFHDYDFVITSKQKIKLIDRQGVNQSNAEYDTIDDVVSALYDDYANHIKDIVKYCTNGDWFKLITENKYIADIFYYMTHADEIDLFGQKRSDIMLEAHINDTLQYLNNTLEFCKENQRNCNLMYEGEEDYDNPWDEDIKGLEGAIEILTNIKTRETKGE